jgi:hypothetical protein
VEQLSLLEWARREHPERGDRDHVARLAARVIRELDETPPIRLRVVASYRDIGDIRVEDIRTAGSLTPEPLGFVMRLRACDSRRRRRFSGFHEVGHTFLPGYRDVVQLRCDPRPPAAGGDHEALADVAASEFLLPRRFFRADLAAAPFGLETVVELADKYDASVQATAHRFVDLWPEDALLVVLEPRRKPAERNDALAEPRLRVVWARGRGRWPYIPAHKSAADGGVLARALAGEVISEEGDLDELGRDAGEDVEVSARAFRYRNRDGELCPQVLALYRHRARCRLAA